ncbi:MAG: hypothetical protein LJE96_14430 [Deltaproteobacteria bacterium]|nr:hypothetical protein [Deltaproteobacteria bacterium]
MESSSDLEPVITNIGLDKEMGDGHSELVGGNLIRGLGGWEAFKKMRTDGQKRVKEDQIFVFGRLGNLAMGKESWREDCE